MKKLSVIFAVILCAISASAELLSPTQKATLLKRRAVSREFVEIDGEKYVVVHYKRGAEDDGSTTNKVQSIAGAVQTSPLRDTINDLSVSLNSVKNDLDSKQLLLDGLRARCERKRDYYLDLESKAVLKTSKELWHAIAEANQEILDYLDGKVDE